MLLFFPPKSVWLARELGQSRQDNVLPKTSHVFYLLCRLQNSFFFLVLFLSRNVYELRVTTEVPNCRKVCVPIKKLLRPRSDSISHSFSCLRSRWDFPHEDVQKQSRGRRGNLNNQHSPLGFASFVRHYMPSGQTKLTCTEPGNPGTPASRHPVHGASALRHYNQVTLQVPQHTKQVLFPSPVGGTPK